MLVCCVLQAANHVQAASPEQGESEASFAFQQTAAPQQRSLPSAAPTPALAAGAAEPAALSDGSDDGGAVGAGPLQAGGAALSADPLLDQGAGFDDYHFDLPPLAAGLEDQAPSIDWSGKTNKEIVSGVCSHVQPWPIVSAGLLLRL